MDKNNLFYDQYVIFKNAKEDELEFLLENRGLDTLKQWLESTYNDFTRKYLHSIYTNQSITGNYFSPAKFNVNSMELCSYWETVYGELVDILCKLSIIGVKDYEIRWMMEEYEEKLQKFLELTYIELENSL